MKKKICFIGNFYKTAVYRKIALELMQKDVSVFWIIPNTSQYREYATEFGKSHVLLIDRTIINDSMKPVADLKINEILYGDRVWKYDILEGKKYLIAVQNLVYKFLKDNEIKTVFGEDTTAEEILIYRLCNLIEDLNCDYFSIDTTRIPGNRFYFCVDEKQSTIFKRKPHPCDDFIDLEVKKPRYAILNDRLVKQSMSFYGVISRLKRFLTDENIENTDPDVLINKRLRLVVKGREVLNQQLYRSVKRKDISYIKDKKYVFYGFHKQPESSIDVCGRYFEDQSQVVKNIWRQLPSDWYLVIKEHSNAIGDRSPKFFKNLLKYPNIVLIRENIDSKFIIEKAQIVITNTGTMGLEAALMGVPSITLSRVIFNCLNYCQHFTWEKFQEFSSLEEIVKYIKSLENNIEDYRELVKKHSFEGYIGDADGTPEILTDESNMEKLVKAFLELVNRYESD